MGLFKKAMELSILTGTQVHVIIFHKESLHEYMSHDPREILKQYCDKAHFPHERYTNEDYNRFDGRGNVLPLEAVQDHEEEEEGEEEEEEKKQIKKPTHHVDIEKKSKYPDSSATQLSPGSILNIENLNHVDKGERTKRRRQPARTKKEKKEQQQQQQKRSPQPPPPPVAPVPAEHSAPYTNNTPKTQKKQEGRHRQQQQQQQHHPRHPYFSYPYPPPMFYPMASMNSNRSPNPPGKQMPTPTTTTSSPLDPVNRDENASRSSPAYPPGPSPYMPYFPTPSGSSPYMFPPPPSEKSPYFPYSYSPYMFPHHSMAYRRKRDEKDGPLNDEGDDPNRRASRRTRYDPPPSYPYPSPLVGHPEASPLGNASPITSEYEYNLDQLGKREKATGDTKKAQILTDGGTDRDISLITTPGP